MFLDINSGESELYAYSDPHPYAGVDYCGVLGATKGGVTQNVLPQFDIPICGAPPIVCQG